MAYLYSNHFSNVELSTSDIFDISQTISRDFSRLSGIAEAPLNAQELLAISDEVSRDYAPCLYSQPSAQRAFVAMSPIQLRDIATEISLGFAQPTLRDSNHLVLLPLDPGHLHVYWQANADYFGFGNGQPAPIAIRIGQKPAGDMFEWLLDTNQGQQTIAIENTGTGHYQGLLVAKPTGNAPMVIAESNRVTGIAVAKTDIPKTLAVPATITQTLQPLSPHVRKTASGQH